MTDELQSFDIDDEQSENLEEELLGEDRAARIDQIKQLAAQGSLDAPAGAEEIVLALVDAMHERDELFAKLQHTVAEHQNFARRAANNEREARTQAQTGVLQSIIPILDHFELALGQNPETTNAESVIGGVRMIQNELLRILGQFGVNVIDPRPGTEFDPIRHEAMMNEQVGDIEPGSVARTMGLGYTLGDRVIRPAKVAVAAAPASNAES